FEASYPKSCMCMRLRSDEENHVKYFIDTHDKTKGSFPQGQLTEAEFFAKFDALEEAAQKVGVGAHAAHVNLKEGKAFCFMSGPDTEAVRRPARVLPSTVGLDQRHRPSRPIARQPQQGGLVISGRAQYICRQQDVSTLTTPLFRGYVGGSAWRMRSLRIGQ